MNFATNAVVEGVSAVINKLMQDLADAVGNALNHSKCGAVYAGEACVV